MRIRFLEIAEIELDEAIEYYNYEAVGLGDDFLAEVWVLWIGLRAFRKHGTPVQRGQGDVKRAVFHMESSTRSANRKYSLLLLQTCTESQTTGSIDYRTSPTSEWTRRATTVRSVGSIRKSLAVVARGLSALWPIGNNEWMSLKNSKDLYWSCRNRR